MTVDEVLVAGEISWFIAGRQRPRAIKKGVIIRPWTLHDWWFSWQLARDPTVREQSVTPNPPTLWRHIRWCWTRWRLPWWQTLIVEAITNLETGHSSRVGQVSGFWRSELMDQLADSLYLNIALVDQCRGFGYGTVVLAKVPSLWCRVADRPSPYYAMIKPTNDASRRAFARAGWEQIPRDVLPWRGHQPLELWCWDGRREIPQ